MLLVSSYAINHIYHMAVLILVVLPIIAIISFIIAVLWGVEKAKNPKKYFIILGCILVIIVFFVSTVFIDYRSNIVNAFHCERLPVEYREYHELKDTVTPNYSIKELDGGSIDEIFTDLLTNNLIVVIRGRNSDADDFYHRIDITGRLLGSFKRPKGIYQSGRFLIGPHAYYNWITTGDTIGKAYIPINGVMSRKAIRPWYKAADYVNFFSDSICILHKDDVWYSCKQDFTQSNYFDDNGFLKKTDYAFAHIADKNIDIQSPSGYGKILLFKDYPASISGGIFSFEYFNKERYYSGFSHLLSGIGSPTGGGDHSERWYGTAYCKLRIGHIDFPFPYSMVYSVGDNDPYRMEVSIYTTPNYAILSGYRTYLISTK